MGSSESSAQGDDFALPQQRIVSGRAAASVGAVARGSAVPVLAKHSKTDGGIKIPVVWDKGSLHVERVGQSRDGTWRLSAEFTAEVPCTLEIHVRCRESKEAGGVVFQRLDAGGPPSLTQEFGAGRHAANLDEKVINLVRWPLHRYWKYLRKESDVIPLVLSLRTTEGTQSILHLSLEVLSAKEKQQSGSELHAMVLTQKVVVQGTEYKLEEIYGIAELGKEHAHDESDMGEPCVICLSESRSTALKPCRHLCVCEECAVQLKLRRDRCPICRSEVQGLQVFDMKQG